MFDNADYDQVDCQIRSSIKRVLEASQEELQHMGLIFETPTGESFPGQTGMGCIAKLHLVN